MNGAKEIEKGILEYIVEKEVKEKEEFEKVTTSNTTIPQCSDCAYLPLFNSSTRCEECRKSATRINFFSREKCFPY